MSARRAAAQALGPVLSGKASLASSLPPQLEHISPRDRALVQELAFGAARWQQRLAALAERFLQRPLKAGDSDIQALLLIGLYQLFYMRVPAHAAIGETVAACPPHKPWAKGLLNAVLRRAQREGEPLLQVLDGDDTVRTAHPSWLLSLMQKQWPDHWQSLCAANNARAPMTLRVNHRQIRREDYLLRLQVKSIVASPCLLSETSIRLQSPCNVEELPGFHEGWVSVQDEAAQLAASLLELAPGQRVLDACSAPGGKTCHLLETEPDLGAVLALDAEPERLQRVWENLERLGLEAHLQAVDARSVEQWWDGQPFQRILLDAPCSATGVIRRHPDVKITRRREDIDVLAQLQGELLDRLWSTLAVEGVLLYATCSVLQQENVDTVENFLRRTPDARELPIAVSWGLPQQAGRQLLPEENGHDGFYYARLIKIAV